jgi:hypothetical protein
MIVNDTYLRQPRTTSSVTQNVGNYAQLIYNNALFYFVYYRRYLNEKVFSIACLSSFTV